MPIIKSAKKRVKVAEKKTIVNRKWKNELKNTIKEFEKVVELGDKEQAEEQLRETKKIIDKSASKGIIHKNNAARKKSRLTRMLNNM